jgi:GNAT superfamily N-acetyltransferase
MLSDATILEAAELAANAFESSPTYREIYRPETRIHGLRRGSLRNDGDGEDDVQSAVSRLIRKDLVALFRRHFKLISQITPEALHFIYDDKNCGPLSEGRGRVMTCFFMLLHSDSEVSIWQKLRAGLLTLLFISGVKSFGRLLAAGDYFDKMKLRTFQFDGTNDRDAAALRDTKNAPISVHLNLARMVVHPDYQGRGIGSAALRRALQTTADEKRLPVVLSTQLDRNVTFYEKL